MTLLLDAAPVASGVGVIAAVVFFFVFLAVAFVAFKMLKRSLKMAFRIAIVVIILVIAVAGSFALWAFSLSKPGRPQPAPITKTNR